MSNQKNEKYDYGGLEAGYYDFKSKSLRKKWHELKFKQVASRLFQNQPNLVIDLGCGPGVFLRDFVSRDIYRFGYDVSKAQVEYANQFSSPTLSFTSNLNELTDILKSMRLTQIRLAVVAIELIEHIDDSELQNIHQVVQRIADNSTAKNVDWIITTPNRVSLWPILERIVDIILGTDYRQQHQFLCSDKTLRERLNRLFGIDFKVESFMSVSDWLFRKKHTRAYRSFLFRGLLLMASRKTH